MDDTAPHSDPPALFTGRPLLPGRLAAWLGLGLVFAVVLGGVAPWIAQYRAPLVVFPLLLGSVLGVCLWQALRLLGVGHRAALLVSTVLLAGVLVAVQHYASYLLIHRTYQRMLAEEPDKALSMRAAFPEEVPPDEFFAFLRHAAQRGRPLFGSIRLEGVWVWLSWMVEALLVAAAAVTIVTLVLRRPYCGVCRKWYQPVRWGSLTKEQVKLLRTRSTVRVPTDAAEIRYRLLACPTCAAPNVLSLWPQGGKSPPGEKSDGDRFILEAGTANDLLAP